LLIIGKVVDLSNTIAWHTPAHECLLEGDQASDAADD